MITSIRRNDSILLSTRYSQPCYKQQGSVLTFSLLILLVISIIGATALNDTVMEEKMSANFQNGHTAFQAAESAINNTVMAIAQTDDLAHDAMVANATAVKNETDPVWPTVATSTISRGHAGSDANAHSLTDLDATVGYAGVNNLPDAGCSLQFGKGNACRAVVLEVVAKGTVTGTNIARTHFQGVEKLLPGHGG